MAHTCSVCSLCVDLTPWNQAHVHRRHTPNARARKAYTKRTKGIHQTHGRHTPNAWKAYTTRAWKAYTKRREGIHQTHGMHTPNARKAYTKRMLNSKRRCQVFYVAPKCIYVRTNPFTKTSSCTRRLCPCLFACT